ncbi:MAG: hypothetical protein KGJ07_00465 [Patescibacteria group bacterium]|nr:hypothetical protein [Patescibacteria group bacterium]MDE2588400.1 hypothetical protein [Patescibacteria group bacterium]
MTEQVPQEPFPPDKAQELAAWVARRGGPDTIEQVSLLGQPRPDLEREQAAAIAQVRESLRPRGLRLRRPSSFRAKEKNPLLGKRTLQIISGTLILGFTVAGVTLFTALLIGLPVVATAVVMSGLGAIGLVGGAALSFRSTRSARA